MVHAKTSDERLNEPPDIEAATCSATGQVRARPFDTSNQTSVREEVEAWTRTPAIACLVEMFGGSIPQSLPLERRLEYLDIFSDRWDFRRKGGAEGVSPGQNQDSGGRARWNIPRGMLSPAEEDGILRLAGELGMVSSSVPQHDRYDHLILIGAGRASSLLRARYAVEILNSKQTAVGQVTLAAAARPLLESERDATDRFAPDAASEFDVLAAAAAIEFGMEIGAGSPIVRGHMSAGMGGSRRCDFGPDANVLGLPVTLLEVPSPEPAARRANSLETLAAAASVIEAGNGGTCLHVTGQPFVPYHHLEGNRAITLRHRAVVETVGFGIDRYLSFGQIDEQHGAKLLQEVRSTIRAARQLVQESSSDS